MQPLAYSYVRFSSKKQELGDSERRQLEETRAYADRKDLQLSEEGFTDLGVSAFRGGNLDAGLGLFLTAVRESKIKADSYLLVENLDRISRRDPWEAFKTFQEIIDAGIILVTLSPVEQEYSLEEIRRNPYLLYPILGQMQQAHEKSKLLSERISQKWKERRAKATDVPMTGKAPGWLRLGKSGHWHIIEEQAETVRRIFQLAIDGENNGSIAAKLNREKVPGLSGKGWYGQTIAYLLSNPAVTGTLQAYKLDYTNGKKRVPVGETIEDYYPCIIDSKIFNEIRKIPKRVGGKAGRTFENILSGLLYCGHCGAPMHLRIKGKNRPAYLSCANSRRDNGCSSKQVRYRPIETALLNVLDCRDMDLTNLLRNDDPEPRCEEIRNRMKEIISEVDKLEARIPILIEGFADNPIPKVKEQIENYDNNIKQLRHEYNELEAEMHKLRYSDDHLEITLQAWGDIKRAVKEPGEQTSDLRIRLNAALKRLIKSIEIDKRSDWKCGHHIFKNFQQWKDPLKAAMVPITINFQKENSHAMIYTYKKDYWRFASMAFQKDDSGNIDNIKLGSDGITGSRPEFQDLFSLS